MSISPKVIAFVFSNTIDESSLIVSLLLTVTIGASFTAVT